MHSFINLRIGIPTQFHSIIIIKPHTKMLCFCKIVFILLILTLGKFPLCFLNSFFCWK